jgi:hypothetical protein
MINLDVEKEDFESLKDIINQIAPDIVGKKLMDYYWYLSGKFAFTQAGGAGGSSVNVGVMAGGFGGGGAAGNFGNAGGLGAPIAIGGGANGQTTLSPGSIGTFTNVGAGGGGYVNAGNGGAGGIGMGAVPLIVDNITIVNIGNAVQLPSTPLLGSQYTIVNHSNQPLTIFAHPQSTYYGDIT